MRILQLLLVGSALIGCGDQILEAVDPAAAPMQPTYSVHIAAIMKRRCTTCHSTEALAGELDGYGYGTCAKVKQHWDGIVETVFEDNSMPPGGADRVESWERLALQRWWDQGATCD